MALVCALGMGAPPASLKALAARPGVMLAEARVSVPHSASLEAEEARIVSADRSVPAAPYEAVDVTTVVRGNRGPC